MNTSVRLDWIEAGGGGEEGGERGAGQVVKLDMCIHSNGRVV